MSAARFPDVMLLAAGLGTRLRPITDSVPKPLVPVAGVPLIERIMANARAEGAKRFVANAHYRADQILAHFGGLLKVSREDELLGTGGGVKRALPMLHSDPILVMNTDAFWPAGSDAPITSHSTRTPRSRSRETIVGSISATPPPFAVELTIQTVRPARRSATAFASSFSSCTAAARWATSS